MKANSMNIHDMTKEQLITLVVQKYSPRGNEICQFCRNMSEKIDSLEYENEQLQNDNILLQNEIINGNSFL